MTDLIEIDREEDVNLAQEIYKILTNIYDLKDENGNLNEDEIEFCFKILIFDDKVFSIISPLLKIFYLREHNISITMNINDKKQQIPNSMAIYMVYPTKENLDMIYSDIANDVFDNISINLVSFEAYEEKFNAKIKEFYKAISNLDEKKINKIYNLNIIPIDVCLYHPRIFSLNIKQPYFLLNSPNISDEDYQNYLSEVSSGIFSVLYLMKVIPVVKYRSNFFGNDIIKKLQNKYKFLFDKVPEIKEEFKLKNSNERTLLLLIDRDVDLPIMLHHACSYGAMVHDHIGIYDDFELDPMNDYIWNSKIQKIFVDVGEYIFKEYKKFYNEMNYLDKVTKPKDMEQLKNESEKLAKSIETLRDKKIIGNILNNESKAYETLNKIQKVKNLDQIFTLECNLLKKREKINDSIKNDFYKLLKNYQIKEEAKIDIYRLCLMYYLINFKNVNEKEINMLKTYIENSDALNYLIKKLTDNVPSINTKNETGLVTGIFSALNSLSNLMSIEQPSISADLLSKLVLNQSLPNWNNYNFFTKMNENDPVKYKYNNVICFFIGGGCLGEYEYIHDILYQQGYNIIYGSDNIYRPIEFVKDLEELGKMK